MIGHMRVGILTSGGDCPGLNAVIRAVYLKGDTTYGIDLIGIHNGWQGLVTNDMYQIQRKDVMGINKDGGTILGTSRTNPYDHGGIERVKRVMQDNELAGLIAIGGEGTLAAAQRLSLEGGINIIGVPKTIDNDLEGTDYTFGFDTAVQIATEAMDRLRTTGDSHGRCMVAEVMGRNAGWIALHSGLATGAHAILIPERKSSIEEVCNWVQSAKDRGRAPLVVVAEGFTFDDMADPHSERGLDAFGRPRLGGIGEIVTYLIEEQTGIESRCTTLGHIQRGGTPTAFDRVLATRYGLAAIDAVHRGDWGQMISLQGTEISVVPFEVAIGKLKTVPASRYEEAAVLFG